MNLSFIIPTCGRESLRHTVDSLRAELVLGDEVLVVYDPGKDPSNLLQKYVSDNMPVKILADHTPGATKWGYKARTYGMRCATKPWIHIIGDDDVYLPGSLAKLRPLLVEQTPILCKMKRRYNDADTIWKVRDLGIGGNQGGEMIVFPNIPEKFGTFAAERYDGDGQFIGQLIAKYGKVRWSEIEICRWRAYE